MAYRKKTKGRRTGRTGFASRGRVSARSGGRKTGNGRTGRSGVRQQTVRLVVEHVQAPPAPLSQFTETAKRATKAKF